MFHVHTGAGWIIILFHRVSIRGCEDRLAIKEAEFLRIYEGKAVDHESQ